MFETLAFLVDRSNHTFLTSEERVLFGELAFQFKSLCEVVIETGSRSEKSLDKTETFLNLVKSELGETHWLVIDTPVILGQK